jgi:endonuclease III
MKSDPCGSARAEARPVMTRITLPQVVDRLQAHYGTQKPPKLDGPWEMILWENVAYLADDDRRQQAFQTLKKLIGTEPAQILSASDEALLEVTRHGIMPELFAEKLRQCAKLLFEEFDGDLRPVLKLPIPKAKRAFQKFPGIGEPGAEKNLLFTRTFPVLALESNGLRALLRLGFGEEKKSYSTTYRLVQKAIGEGLNKDYSWLIQTHLLLRRHGQELCRRSEPMCDKCPLAGDCEFYQRGSV